MYIFDLSIGKGPRAQHRVVGQLMLRASVVMVSQLLRLSMSWTFFIKSPNLRFFATMLVNAASAIGKELGVRSWMVFGFHDDVDLSGDQYVFISELNAF